jgi:hypothetical protein
MVKPNPAVPNGRKKKVLSSLAASAFAAGATALVRLVRNKRTRRDLGN